MRISQMACRALHLLLFLPDHGTGTPVSAAELAQETGISEQFIQKIMRLLQAGGIVKSFRGIAGGHMLARDPESISLADIVTAVEGGILLPSSDEESPAARAALAVWGEAAVTLHGALNSVSLKSVRQNCRSALATSAQDFVQPAPHLVAGTELEEPRVKAYSLGRQRCRKQKSCL